MSCVLPTHNAEIPDRETRSICTQKMHLALCIITGVIGIIGCLVFVYFLFAVIL